MIIFDIPENYFFFSCFSDNKCQNWIYQWIDGKNGYLQSPNFPQEYGSNINCEWMIIGYENYWITLQFHELDVSIIILIHYSVGKTN